MKKKPKTYKGKSMKLGGGGRFQKMKEAIMATGSSEESAEKIAASKGRKKYGKMKMAKWAAQGRKRKKKV